MDGGKPLLCPLRGVRIWPLKIWDVMKTECLDVWISKAVAQQLKG